VIACNLSPWIAAINSEGPGRNVMKRLMKGKSNPGSCWRKQPKWRRDIMKKTVRFVSFLAAFALALSIPGATGAWADSGFAARTYLIGAFVPPAVAMAANGDTIELTGAGTLSIHPKSVSGGGTFTHKDSSGNILGVGAWTATELLTFKSYAVDPAEGVPDNFGAGYSRMRVHLGPGFDADAILDLDCEFGLNPPGHAEEGVRLAVEGGPNFNRKVSGFTLFLIP
jgi:hypothetical protein